MKNILKFLLYYLLVYLGTLIVLTFIYIQYISCTHIVIGSTFPFSYQLLIYAVFKALPLVTILTPFILTVYKVRHKGFAVSSALTYSIVCLLSFLVFLPCIEAGRDIAYKRINTVNFETNLNDNIAISGGYFRKVGDKTYYFIDDSYMNYSHVVELHDAKDASMRPEDYLLSVDLSSEFAKSTYPFRDTSLKEILGNTVYNALEVLDILLFSVTIAHSNGVIPWLFFITLGLALASCYGFVRFSSWSMMNYLFVISNTIYIILFNCFYYTQYFSPIRVMLEELIFGEGATRFRYFYNHRVDLPLCLINIITASLILAAGIIVSKIRKVRDNEDDLDL